MMQDGGLDCVTGLGKYQGRLIILLDIKKVLSARESGSGPLAGEPIGAGSGPAGAASASSGK